MSKIRNHDAPFTACVVLEALKGERTVSELAATDEVDLMMNNQDREALQKGAAGISCGSGKLAGSQICAEGCLDLTVFVVSSSASMGSGSQFSSCRNPGISPFHMQISARSSLKQSMARSVKAFIPPSEASLTHIISP